MDLAGRRWADAAVRATAPQLAPELPSIVEPWSVIGRLSGYWTAVEAPLNSACPWQRRLILHPR